jgi:hypothetical protein
MVVEVTMLEPNRLLEIEQIHRNSQFGYDTKQPAVYARAIGDLLEERRELLDKIAALEAAAVKPTPAPRRPRRRL